MDPKLFRFVVLMTFITVFVWIIGEVVIVALLKLGTLLSIIWTTFMIGSLLVINIARALKDDDDQNKRNW